MASGQKKQYYPAEKSKKTLQWNNWPVEWFYGRL